VTLDHIDLMCFLSLVYTLACMLQFCYLSLIIRIWVHTWLVMLNHAVMSVTHVFPSLVKLSLASVFVRYGLQSVEM
jgi:hypothetical protein